MKKTNNFSFRDESTVLAPGKYWTGDPCYVVPKIEWLDFCHASFINNSTYSGWYKNKYNFFARGTSFGDGTYPVEFQGKKIGECGVDAGILSIIPEKLIKLWKSEKNYTGVWPNMGGVWIELNKELEVIPVGDGSFKFGDYFIDTEGENEDDEYNYNEDIDDN